MNKTRTSAIPPVPAKVPRELRPFLESVRENVEVSLGRRGKKLDKSVTFRDLVDGDIASVSLAGGNISLSPPVTLPPNVYPIPDAPTGIQIVAGFNFVLISWDIPRYTGHSFTEVYRSTEDLLGSAVLVGTTTGFLFRDDAEPDTEYYYWVRFVNLDSIPGPYNATAGAWVQTAQSYDDLIDEAEADILDALQVWQNQLTSAQDIIDDSVVQNAIDNATQYQELADRIIAAEGRLNSSIDSSSTVAANNNETTALQVNTLTSSIYQVDSNGDLIVDADGNYVLAGGFITNVDNTFANIDGVFWARIGTDLTVDDGMGNQRTLSEIAGVAYSPDEGFVSQWGVKTTIDELQYGVGFVEVAGKTSFTVAVDTFAVYNPANGEDSFPFIVNSDGQTLIKDAFIDTASITTLIAATIVTDNLFFGERIEGPLIRSAEIFGGSLDIGLGRTTINEQGLLTTNNAIIHGHVDATSGELDNVTINDTCTVLGTVSAKNIIGDVLDRKVVVLNEEFVVSAPNDLTVVEGDILEGVIGGDSDRTLVVSGMSFDHENGGGSSSNFEVALYLDGIEQQRFKTRNVEEEGSVTPTLGCSIPKNTGTRHFEVRLEPGTDDNITVHQSAIVIDITKKGDTIKEVEAFKLISSSSGGGSGGEIPDLPGGGVVIH